MFYLCTESIDTLGVSHDLSDSLERLGVLLGLVEFATHGTSFLSAEIDGGVLLVSVVLAELSTLGLVEDSENTGDVLSDNVAVKKKIKGWLRF